MTDPISAESLDLLEQKARAVQAVGWGWVTGRPTGLNQESVRYIAAASPDVVLSLIEVLREARRTAQQLAVEHVHDGYHHVGAPDPDREEAWESIRDRLIEERDSAQKALEEARAEIERLRPGQQ